MKADLRISITPTEFHDGGRNEEEAEADDEDDSGSGPSYSILFHHSFQFLAQLVQVARRCFGLFCAGSVLHAGLLDILHGGGHLVRSNQLLLAGSGDLSRGLRGFGDDF